MTTDVVPAAEVAVDAVVVPYSSWIRRVVAIVLDSLVLSFVSFLATGVALGPTSALVVFGASTAPSSWWVVAAVLGLLTLQAYTGSTPGKRVVGIAILSERTGRPIGLLRTIGRELAHLVDAILFIGYLRPLWNDERRTFADSICGTNVLRTQAVDPSRTSPVTLAAAALCAVGVLAAVPTTSATAASRSSCYGRVAGDQMLQVAVEVPGTVTETRLGISRTTPNIEDVSVRWVYTQVAPYEQDPDGDGFSGDPDDFAVVDDFYQTDQPAAALAGSSLTVTFSSAFAPSTAGTASVDGAGYWSSSGSTTGTTDGQSFPVSADRVAELGVPYTWSLSTGDQPEGICSVTLN